MITAESIKRGEDDDDDEAGRSWNKGRRKNGSQSGFVKGGLFQQVTVLSTTTTTKPCANEWEKDEYLREKDANLKVRADKVAPALLYCVPSTPPQQTSTQAVYISQAPWTIMV
jgi:hypothetical protein